MPLCQGWGGPPPSPCPVTDGPREPEERVGRRAHILCGRPQCLVKEPACLHVTDEEIEDQRN